MVLMIASLRETTFSLDGASLTVDITKKYQNYIRKKGINRVGFDFVTIWNRILNNAQQNRDFRLGLVTRT